jgi:glycosyltransferase involved in cell wall biosynthesis
MITKPVSMLHLRVVAGTGGGPEKTILNSPRFIKPFGYDAHVAYLCPPGDPVRESLMERASKADCPLTIIDDNGPLDMRTLQQVMRLCRSLNVQLLQAHDYKSNVIGLLARRFRRMAMSTMLHGWTNMSGRMPLYKRIDQFSLRFFQALICVSSDLAEECRNLRIPERKIHLVHNGIDTQFFCRELERQTAKQQVSARPDRVLLGSVGRLSPEKGLIALIQTTKTLQGMGHPIDLAIAGDGPQRPELESLVKNLGMSDSVRLFGQVKDLKPLYQAMDCFVLNSIREGLPNVLLEAMALETPVISTAIAGIPDLITDGVHGRLISADSNSELQQAILAFLGEPDRNQSMMDNARRRIEEEFSFEHRMRKITAIYQKLLEPVVAHPS